MRSGHPAISSAERCAHANLTWLACLTPARGVWMSSHTEHSGHPDVSSRCFIPQVKHRNLLRSPLARIDGTRYDATRSSIRLQIPEAPQTYLPIALTSRQASY